MLRACVHAVSIANAVRMNFQRIRRGFFLASGVLLGMECANQAYPVYTKWRLVIITG